jgi:hypothetical protein
MGSQRNQPCPCGSGKKYKNCCLQLSLYKPEPESPDLEWCFDDFSRQFEEELFQRSVGEVAFDDIIVKCLQEGVDIRDAVATANSKYPSEALVIDDDNLDEVFLHYDYLVNHLEIKQKISELRNKHT